MSRHLPCAQISWYLSILLSVPDDYQWKPLFRWHSECLRLMLPWSCWSRVRGMWTRQWTLSWLCSCLTGFWCTTSSTIIVMMFPQQSEVTRCTAWHSVWSLVPRMQQNVFMSSFPTVCILLQYGNCTALFKMFFLVVTSNIFLFSSGAQTMLESGRSERKIISGYSK